MMLPILLLLFLCTSAAEQSTQSTQDVPQRLSKVTDLEIRLLSQKITTKELQIQQLRQQIQADRKALNDLIASACKSKSIEVQDCDVRILNDEDGEYVAVSSVVK